MKHKLILVLGILLNIAFFCFIYCPLFETLRKANISPSIKMFILLLITFSYAGIVTFMFVKWVVKQVEIEMNDSKKKE